MMSENIKKGLILAAAIAWILGANDYTASLLVSILENIELQANVLLTLALIPSVTVDIRFYQQCLDSP